MAYFPSTQKLKIILKSVEISQKPSPAVIGIRWAYEPITTVELLPVTKKSAIEISFGSEYTLRVKRSKVALKTLRLTIYDSRRKHVHVPNRTRDFTFEKCCKYTKDEYVYKKSQFLFSGEIIFRL